MSAGVRVCARVRTIFPGNGHQLCARAQLSSHGIHQAPDRAPSRMAVGMSVPCERSKSSVARRSNHQGIYCPHDEWREGELSGRGWREERRKGWKQQTRAVEKWKERLGESKEGVEEGKKRGETERRIAKHGWKGEQGRARMRDVKQMEKTGAREAQMKGTRQGKAPLEGKWMEN